MKKPPDKILQAAKIKLDNPNITMRQLGKIVGCSPQNIQQAFERHNIDWIRTQSYKQLEAHILTGYKEKLLAGITPEKIEKTGVKDLSVSMGIIDDKLDRLVNKTTAQDLLSEVIEKASKKRRTTITIEQTDSIMVDKLDNKVIEAQAIVE